MINWIRNLDPDNNMWDRTIWVAFCMLFFTIGLLMPFIAIWLVSKYP
jgi:hypothetical protein